MLTSVERAKSQHHPIGELDNQTKKHQLRKMYTAYYTPFETVTMVVAAVEGTLVPNRSAH